MKVKSFREHAESLEKIILFSVKVFIAIVISLFCIPASKTFAADAAAVQTQTVQNINPGAAATVSANMSKTLSADQIAAIQALQLQALHAAEEQQAALQALADQAAAEQQAALQALADQAVAEEKAAEEAAEQQAEEAAEAEKDQILAASGISEEDYDALCRIVEAEAGSESQDGKLLVADVILNRVADPEFPDTIQGVITQSGQFTPVSNGSYRSAVPSADTVAAVNRALKGENISNGAIYFKSVNSSSNWSAKKFLFNAGGHNFYS